MNRCALLLLMTATATPTATANGAPHRDDYAQGIDVTTLESRPLVDVLLPDAVYQATTSPNLADVRVFNAAGVAVPQAFCVAADASPPAVSTQSLPVFDLQAATPSQDEHGARVEVATAGGTQVRIQEGGSPAASPAATRTWAHVIDAREIKDELRSLEFDWISPDGASQASVRIESSNDLDRWVPVVNSSTLLRVTRDGQQLQRKVIPLPQRHYEYLRIVRTDGGPSLQITQAFGERVARGEAIEPVWFTATAQASRGNELRFDAARLAPVTYARLVLPQQNSSVRVHIRSRPDEQAQWHERWAGEVYAVTAGNEQRVSPPAEFDAIRDRYWQVAYANDSDALDPAPALELGYRPARLRFLAQGAGPYTLAFGSRRAEPAPVQQCSSLLSDVRGTALDELVSAGSLGDPQILGGNTALKPLPRQTPVRTMVFWGVLVVGVGLLIAMAMALMKRIK